MASLFLMHLLVLRKVEYLLVLHTVVHRLSLHNLDLTFLLLPPHKIDLFVFSVFFLAPLSLYVNVPEVALYIQICLILFYKDQLVKHSNLVVDECSNVMKNTVTLMLRC